MINTLDGSFKQENVMCYIPFICMYRCFVVLIVLSGWLWKLSRQ